MACLRWHRWVLSLGLLFGLYAFNLGYLYRQRNSPDESLLHYYAVLILNPEDSEAEESIRDISDQYSINEARLNDIRAQAKRLLAQ